MGFVPRLRPSSLELRLRDGGLLRWPGAVDLLVCGIVEALAVLRCTGAGGSMGGPGVTCVNQPAIVRGHNLRAIYWARRSRRAFFILPPPPPRSRCEAC